MSTTDNSDDTIDNGQSTDRTFDRRGFVRNALGAAALAAVPTSLTAQGGTAPPATGRGADTTPPRPLGNGEPPAMVFQPYPGGTGSYLEKLAKERGRDAFERERFTVEGWRSEEHTSELQSRLHLVCRLLLE